MKSKILGYLKSNWRSVMSGAAIYISAFLMYKQGEQDGYRVASNIMNHMNEINPNIELEMKKAVDIIMNKNK